MDLCANSMPSMGNANHSVKVAWAMQEGESLLRSMCLWRGDLLCLWSEHHSLCPSLSRAILSLEHSASRMSLLPNLLTNNGTGDSGASHTSVWRIFLNKNKFSRRATTERSFRFPSRTGGSIWAKAAEQVNGKSVCIGARSLACISVQAHCSPSRSMAFWWRPRP